MTTIIIDKAVLLNEVSMAFDTTHEIDGDMMSINRILMDHGRDVDLLRQALTTRSVSFANRIAGSDNRLWRAAMAVLVAELQSMTSVMVGTLANNSGRSFSPAEVAVAAYMTAASQRHWWTGSEPIPAGKIIDQWAGAIAIAQSSAPDGSTASATAGDVIEGSMRDVGLDPVDGPPAGIEWGAHIPTLPAELSEVTTRLERAERALERAGYVDAGGAEWKPVAGQYVGFGVMRIRAERSRQIAAKGYSLESDREYTSGQLMGAAWSYLEAVMHRDASTPSSVIAKAPPPMQWPWAHQFWKPKTSIADLTRAGALIAAEIDVRLADRDDFVDLIVEACVAGGADRNGARTIVETSIEDVLEKEGIEVGHPDHDWGVSGAAAFAEELVLRHLETQANG